MTDSGAAARRARRALQAIVVLALWGLLTHGTFAGSGDEPHYLAIAHSIAFDGDLDLSNNYGANEPLVGGGVLEPESHVRRGVDGVVRPVHDVGMPLLFAPVVRIAVPLTRALSANVSPETMRRARLTPAVLYRHLLSLVMIGVATVLAGLMFDTFLALGGSIRAAFGTALLLTLSPPLLIFSILFFTELLTALICFIVFRRIAIIRVNSPSTWWMIGTLIGLLFLVHARNIGLVIPLTVLAVQSLRARSTRHDAGAFAVGLFGTIAIRTIVNHHFWGMWITSPHARLSGSIEVWSVVRETVVRVTGLLIDQEFGLLIYAPIYVLALTGLVVLWNERDHLGRQIVLIASVYVLLIVLPITNVHGWTGGWSPAARFLTPLVPLLGVAVFAGLRTAHWTVVAILLLAQITIDAYAWQHPKILWNEGDGRAAFCATLGERVCRSLPSLVPRRSPEVTAPAPAAPR